MKRFFSVLILFAVAAVSHGQEIVQQDSTVVVVRNIFEDLSERGPAGNRVTISQPFSLEQMLARHREFSIHKKTPGFRVRIYFDNRQEARNRSSEVESRFTESYPGVPAYRTYAYPYFKVTVGDFRSRSAAMMFLKKIESDFPSAFIVRENINLHSF